MASTFYSNDEWKEYYTRHKSIDRCYECHGKKNCVVPAVTFGNDPGVVRTVNNKRQELAVSEKDKISKELTETCEELRNLANGLR